MDTFFKLVLQNATHKHIANDVPLVLFAHENIEIICDYRIPSGRYQITVADHCICPPLTPPYSHSQLLMALENVWEIVK